MKIIFLGTCHGSQEKNRYFTSMILETSGQMYLIDAGAPFLYLMKNMDIPYDKMKAGFITHMHSDHALQAYSYFMTCPGCLYLPEESDIKSMESLVHFMHEEWAYKHCVRCKLKSVHDGVFYDDGTIKVTAIPTKHLKSAAKSFAYMIEGEGRRVLFTGDLSTNFEDYPNVAEEYDFDAVVCELTHFSIDAAIPKLNRTRTKKMIFNHVRDDKVAILKDNEELLTLDYHIANDGDVIEI